MLALATVLVGMAIGCLMGGYDRGQNMSAAAITAFLVGGLDPAGPVHAGLAGVLQQRQCAADGPSPPSVPSTPNIAGRLLGPGLDTFTHLILPTVALILISLAVYTRYTRASMLEIMNMDYIRTARAKGLTERTVVMRHAFRNALIPIATIVAFDIGGLIGGAVITETRLRVRGMGQLFLQALDRVDPEPGDGRLLCRRHYWP